MKQVHVECSPDELLVSKIGIKSSRITHHQGKSRVFFTLNKNKDQSALVDEDPGSSKTRYEKSLQLIDEFEGIKCFIDQSGNKVLILKGKLEDWIIKVCEKEKIDLDKYSLPNKPNELHGILNSKLRNFSKLIDVLLKKKNPAILKLQAWLNS